MTYLCQKIIPSRSKYSSHVPSKCQCIMGHRGKCQEFPFLVEMRSANKSVAEKIKRDSTMTTGASWKSEDAGPNRILRWVVLLEDDVLEKEFGIPMSTFSELIKSKLREKGASYDDCMSCARKLTLLAYNMKNAPQISNDLENYFQELGMWTTTRTTCLICKEYLDFNDFKLAQRGKAILETAHASPRQHNIDNVGFAHRTCNIAQGNRTLDDFYKWIEGILERNGFKVSP